MGAVIFRQAELPFSEEDKVQMLRDDNRHLKEENAALREEIERMRRMLFGSSSEKMEKGDWIVTVEEKPLPEEPKDEPKAATETGKKAEGYAGPGFLDTRLTHVLLALSQGSAYHLTKSRTTHHEQPYT